MRGWSSLCARVIEADERTAKAAIYGLNRASGKTSELEEAWIVHALVREDGLPQVEVADLLGRHKSWVCRRLALIEKLGEPAQEELKVGLLSPTCARQLVRLPPGNQPALLAVIRREALTVHELEGVVDLLLRAPSRELQQYILDAPREALTQADGDVSAVARPAAERDRQPGVATPGAAARAAGADGGLADARRPRRA